MSANSKDKPINLKKAMKERRKARDVRGAARAVMKEAQLSGDKKKIAAAEKAFLRAQDKVRKRKGKGRKY